MANTWLSALNQQQRQVVENTEGPTLVLAGAGSGKTRCITYRVAYLIKEKLVDPERILLLTFTNKAAKEMKQRVEKLVGSSSLFAGTFHSMCAKLLRQHGRSIGVPINYLIYDEKDQAELVKEAILQIDVSTSEFKPRSVLATISQAKNELISALEYPQYARGHWQTTVARIYLKYQELLLKAQALDFDDLLLKTVELLRKDENVRKHYQDKWMYVLVDEYQDTNQAQFELTKLVCGKWRNLCCVGDFSQSIYKWRGADFRNLERLKQEFADINIFNLEQNYRSTQNILDAAHGVITHNNSHPVLKLWTDKKRGEKVGLFEAIDEKDEAKFIVNKLKNNHSSYNDFAVLYRTNAQSRAIEEALIQAGIPYVLVGGTRFYQRKEIKDLIAYFRVLVNSQDSISYKRIEKLGKRRLNNFEEKMKQIDVAKYSTAEILDQVLDATGYLDKFDPKDEEDLGRLENIKELRSVAEEFKDLNLFLENVALVEQDQLKDVNLKTADKQAVTLMTLHAAKGLEFVMVFMVGMEEGLFPHSRSMLEKEELEEERRLMYVGMTRAKQKLFLSYARKRLYFGLRNRNMVSRFIGEVPEELLEFEVSNNKYFDFEL